MRKAVCIFPCKREGQSKMSNKARAGHQVSWECSLAKLWTWTPTRTGETASPGMCLPCKCDDLSQIPNPHSPRKKCKWEAVCMCNLSPGETELRHLLSNQPSQSASSRLCLRPCLKKSNGKHWRKTLDTLTCNLYIHAHTHEHIGHKDK